MARLLDVAEYAFRAEDDDRLETTVLAASVLVGRFHQDVERLFKVQEST